MVSLNTIKIKDCEIKKNTIMEVGQFAILWNIFENENFVKGEFSEQINARRLNAQDKTIIVANRIKEKLNDEIVKFFSIAIQGRVDIYNFTDNTIEQYVTYELVSDQSYGLHESYRNLIQDFIKNPVNDNFAGCLLAILQIRNNMFHGFKQYSDLNNQIDLFKSANEVLRMVITEV